MLINNKRPNFLILMNDEERFPPPYENAEAREWRLEHSKTRLEIARHGLSLSRHYTGAIACAPSRATLFTGQYPACTVLANPPDWLNPVPTPRCSG